MNYEIGVWILFTVFLMLGISWGIASLVNRWRRKEQEKITTLVVHQASQTQAENQLIAIQHEENQRKEEEHDYHNFEKVYDDVLDYIDENRERARGNQGRVLCDISWIQHVFGEEYEDVTIRHIWNRLVQDYEVVKDPMDHAWIIGPNSSRMRARTSLVEEQKVADLPFAIEALDNTMDSLLGTNENKSM